MKTAASPRADSADQAVASRQLVIITGAGASMKLGADGVDILLMTDWVNSLIAALDEAIPGIAGHLGLVPNLAGNEFERGLGEYLASKDSRRSPSPTPTFGAPATPASQAPPPVTS